MSFRSHALAALTAWGLCGCLDPIAPDVGDPVVGRCDPEDTDPEEDVSFQVDVLPLLARPGREGGCGCHSAASNGVGYQLSGLDLTTYETTMRGGRLSSQDSVVAGDPCISVLYLKLTSAPPFGARMPVSGPPFFSAEEMRLVHDWIAEGADAD